MKNVRRNPDTIKIERQIERERQRLNEALIKNESITVISRQLKKILKLAEQKEFKVVILPEIH